MFKRIFNLTLILLFFFNPVTFAGGGYLFNVASSGTDLAQAVDFTLCLNINGQTPLSCQNFTSQKAILAIHTTIPNHTYTTAGIRVNTPGYTYTAASGFKKHRSIVTAAQGFIPLGSVSQTQSAMGTLFIKASATVPGSPTGVTASAGNASATVIWIAPSSTGGTAITHYIITPYKNTVAQTPTTVGNVLTTSITGLTNGSNYTFTVAAENGAGVGPASTASNTIMPSGDGRYTVPSFPQVVIATAGSGAVTLTWTAPNNAVNGAVTGYSVDYGVTSTNAYTTPAANCQQINATTCTVSGLTNGVSYTFTVNATNASGTGPWAYSSPAIPMVALSANPLTLALSGLGGGAERIITISNNSGNSVTVNSVGSPSPALPAGTSLNTTSAVDCSKLPTLTAGGGKCTITISPGSTATSGCTDGTTLPIPSQITVNTSAGMVSAYVVILGYGCLYQGGYIYSIDDTTPNTSSIGGKVVTTNDQVNGQTKTWSPGGDSTSIWGIDPTSTISAPSPNSTSPSVATLVQGQLNCNAENDGACATNNVVVYYSGAALNTYAAGICRQQIDESGATPCTTGACYQDWYLPAVCDFGPYGSSGYNSGNYPYYGGTYRSCASSQSIATNLDMTGIVYFGNDYWSSTEDYDFSSMAAWVQALISSADSQARDFKNSANDNGIRCVRNLTL